MLHALANRQRATAPSKRRRWPTRGTMRRLHVVVFLLVLIVCSHLVECKRRAKKKKKQVRWMFVLMVLMRVGVVICSDDMSIKTGFRGKT